MQKLSDVPFDLLRVGDRVKSEITNNEGVIQKLIPAYNEIAIDWNNGCHSQQWQVWLDHVWLM